MECAQLTNREHFGGPKTMHACSNECGSYEWGSHGTPKLLLVASSPACIVGTKISLCVCLYIGMYVIPRPVPGGGQNLPPPLPDFRDNSKTVADIDTNFWVPYPTSILHRLCNIHWNPVAFLNCVFVTSLQAIFGQNRLNFEKFTKNIFFKKSAQKS